MGYILRVVKMQWLSIEFSVHVSDPNKKHVQV